MLSLNSLVQQFLGEALPDHLIQNDTLTGLSLEARKFLVRAMALMKRAGYSPSNFNPPLIRGLLTTVPSLLPAAWGGRIPPLTTPGRHKKFDDYVADQIREHGSEPNIFIDLGCGFPPVTTTDTAKHFIDWQIYGVDTSFSDYVLYDHDGYYACYDRQGRLRYYQALMSTKGQRFYANPDSARYHFNNLFSRLFPLINDDNSMDSKTVAKDGNRLIHNHIRDFETDNLTFLESDIGTIAITPAKVVRCMNVLIYFKSDIRKKMLLKAGQLLDDGGILIAGTNGLGVQSRYAVYKNGSNGLFPDEFAFSLDNLGHMVFMPWLTIHDNDPEAMLLAELIGRIRADSLFWSKFSVRLDDLLKAHGICQRKTDGFLHFSNEEMPPREFLYKNNQIWQQMEEDGYSENAVHVLRRAGYKAWKNTVGDIAIKPKGDF